MKGAAVKFALADEVGDGFACAAALGELFETGKGVGCDGVLAVADGLAVCPVLDGLNEYAAFVTRQLAMVLPFGVIGLGHGVVWGGLWWVEGGCGCGGLQSKWHGGVACFVLIFNGQNRMGVYQGGCG